MAFIQKIKESLNILNKSFDLYIFKVENDNELKILYDNNREDFMKIMFSYIPYRAIYFNSLLIEDREFLDSYNNRIVSYINNKICEGNGIDINYFETNQFNYKDFTIDDFLTIVKILDNPPLPITRHYFNEEQYKNKDHMILKIFNESPYKSINSLKKMSKNVINGILDDSFKFILNNGKIYNLNKSLTDQFEIFRIVRANEIKLNTDNNLIVEILIEFLYTGSFDYKSLSKDNLLELIEIAIFLQINILVQIINILLNDDNIINENRNIKLSLLIVKDWLYFQLINILYEDVNCIVKRKEYLTNYNLLESVENQDIEGINKSLNLIKNDLNEYIDKNDFNYDCDDYDENERSLIKQNAKNEFKKKFENKNLIIDIFYNINYLPSILKNEVNKIKNEVKNIKN